MMPPISPGQEQKESFEKPVRDMIPDSGGPVFCDLPRVKSSEPVELGTSLLQTAERMGREPIMASRVSAGPQQGMTRYPFPQL